MIDSVFAKKYICCGCRGCEQRCPTNSISMKFDEEGFLYPEINQCTCIQCGCCTDVCKQLENVSLSENSLECYAAQNLNSESRIQSSSGGVFSLIAEDVLKDGGVVFGAAFNESLYVMHDEINSIGNLERLMGSKYVQSDTNNTFSRVKKHLEYGKKVLYSGVPCQIAGLKSFLGKEYENLFCVSVICHGVPSPKVWEKYLETLGGKNNVCDVYFRKKTDSWRNGSFSYRLKDKMPWGGVETLYTEDLFVKGFLQNLYLRPSCYSCRVKESGFQADVVLGDFWGVEKYHAQMDDDMGTSAVICVSEKGKLMFEKIKKLLLCQKTLYSDIEKNNALLRTSVNSNSKRNQFFGALRNDIDVKKAIESNLNKPIDEKERYWFEYQTILQYLKNKIYGYSIPKFLLHHNYKKIAVYAMCDFSKFICDDLLISNVDGMKVVCICDKNTENYGSEYNKIPIVSIDKLLSLYINKQVDVVIIGNTIRENAIINELLRKGIRQKDIYSINSVLFSSYNNAYKEGLV